MYNLDTHRYMHSYKSLSSHSPLVTVLDFLTACTSLHWTDYVHFASAKPYKSKRVNVIEAVVLLNLLLITTFFLNVNFGQTKPICTHFGTAIPTIAFPFHVTLHHHSPSQLSMVSST